jgi:uncharacterized protein
MGLTSSRHTWIQTYSGLRFDVTNPLASAMTIMDIAMPLSRACRFGGHCLSFYSVAEHSVLAAEKAKPEHKMAVLMHDASEAYLVDIPRPIKHLLLGYKHLEDDIMNTLAKKYGFQWPLPTEVIEIDARMLTDEREQNMATRLERGTDWGNPLPALGVRLQFWSAEQAYEKFMLAFAEYGGKE